VECGGKRSATPLWLETQSPSKARIAPGTTSVPHWFKEVRGPFLYLCGKSNQVSNLRKLDIDLLNSKVQSDPKTRRRLRIALASAILIDCIQIGLFPLFIAGGFSVPDDFLDCIAFVFFWRLLGWHWALVPGFLFELLPFVDLAPTWTLAVYITVKSKQLTTDPDRHLKRINTLDSTKN
jgi:hypothetical protein